MMLDGALRFGQQARQWWDDEANRLEVDRLVRRTLDIVEELVRSVALGRAAESARLEEEYAFIFRQLAAAHLTHDPAAMDEALKLLVYQRETWRQACEKVKASATPAPNFDPNPTSTMGFSLQA
jgi:flagellar biosynthetic protein FliS